MKDCTTCKYGYEDEQFGIPMCHHPERFSEDCVDFNMHEEKEVKEPEIPKDLEEAAEKHASMHPLCNGKPAKNSFIAGAKWDRQQMLKEAVEGEVYLYHSYKRDAAAILVDIPKETLGDKVRIIIVKE